MRVDSQCFIRLVLITLEVPLIPIDKISHWEHPKNGLHLDGFQMTAKYVFLSAIKAFYNHSVFSGKLYCPIKSWILTTLISVWAWVGPSCRSTYNRWWGWVWRWNNRWNGNFKFMVTTSRQICKRERKNWTYFEIQTRIWIICNGSSLLVSLVWILDKLEFAIPVYF